jgi:hypothetical protein
MMTSNRKILANRINATRSTGPRTALGRRRVSRNALRHGLATSILEDPVKCAEVERLARALVPAGAADQLDMARVIGEAELELLRVRTTRATLIHLNELAIFADAMAAKSEPYDGQISNIPYEKVPEQTEWIPQELERQALAVLRALPKLARLDRYERRAFSRRQRAIRRLDRP